VGNLQIRKAMKVRIKREILNGDKVYTLQKRVWVDVAKFSHEDDAHTTANFVKDPYIRIDETKDIESVTFEDLQCADGEDTVPGRDGNFGRVVGVSAGQLPHDKEATVMPPLPRQGCHMSHINDYDTRN
jgi:hypothetical protein